jgi:hypothetical protein
MKIRVVRQFTLIAMPIMFALVLNVPSANARASTYEDFASLDLQTFVFGDIVTVSTGLCWSSKKPNTTVAKNKLQRFEFGTWKDSGVTIFSKNPVICGSKKPYEKFFQWEVDRLGVTSSDGFSGKLRLRNVSQKPAVYVVITIYESVQSKEQEAVKKEREEANRIAIVNLQFMCLVFGGQWDSSRNICVPSP